MPKLNVDLIVDDQGSVVVKNFGANVLQMAAGFATGQLALDLLNRSLGLFREEVFAGLKAVEDYNLKVASMTAFITTFSETAAQGDLAGGFREANEYAQALVSRVELLDAKTIASGQDLQVLVETMAMNGVILDINNKKQEEGFVNIATALKLVTAGQNQDIQMRQEINALLQGQIRATDRLPKLLQAIDPHLAKHLEQWKQEGTLIENVGALLKGFGASGDLVSATWAAIGSSMETIHNRVMRGGMLPMYEDLLAIAKQANEAFIDQNGNLTEMGRIVQGSIAVAWLDIKNTVEIVGDLIRPFEPLLSAVGKTTMFIADGWGMLLALLTPLAETIGDIGQAMSNVGEGINRLRLGDLSGAKKSFAEAGKDLGEVLSASVQDELDKRLKALEEYEDAKNIGISAPSGAVKVPKIGAPQSKEQLEEAEKAAREQERITRDLTDKINKMTMEQYEYKRWALGQEILDLQQKAGKELALQAATISQYGNARELGLIREVAAEDRKQLQSRLTEYQKFYADLNKEIQDHLQKEMAALKTLGDLYQQQSDLRRSTEGLIVGLGGAGRSDLEQYRLTRDELEQQLQIAKMLTGQDQIAALEQYKQAVSSLAQEFKQGVGNLGGEEIAARAIRDIQAAYELQQQAMRGLEADTNQQITTNRTWGRELEAEARQAALHIDSLKEVIVQLDEQMRAMDQVLAITADDRASSIINEIRREVEMLHDKTITITTVYQAVGGGAGGSSGGGEVPVLDSYAIGTGYVPETGPYYLHRGESVNTAAETMALSAGGGKYQVGGGGGMTVQGGITLVLPEGTTVDQIPAVLQDDNWWRMVTREKIAPQMEALRHG